MNLQKNMIHALVIGLSAFSSAYAEEARTTHAPVSCFEKVEMKTKVAGSFKLNITQYVMEVICEKDLRESDRSSVASCESKVRKLLVGSNEIAKKLTEKVPELKPYFRGYAKNADGLGDFLFSRTVLPITINDSEEGSYGDEDSYITFDDAYTKFQLDDVTGDTDFIDGHVKRNHAENRLWKIKDKIYYQDLDMGLGARHLLANQQQPAFEAVSSDLHKVFLSNYIGESMVVIPNPSTYTINDAIFAGPLPRFQIFIDTSHGSPILYLNQWLVEKNGITLVDQKAFPLNQRNEVKYDADILKGRGHLSAIYSFGCK